MTRLCCIWVAVTTTAGLVLGGACGATAAAPYDAQVDAPGVPIVSEHQVRVGGTVRRFRLAVPSSFVRGGGLVVVFHGGGRSESGATIAAQTGFDDVATRRGWAIAYPNGIDGEWNSGAYCSTRTGRHSNDVAFFDALLKDLRRRGISTDRVAVAGFSTGAFFVHRLACERAPRIAAGVAVAGTLLTKPCRPAAPVSMAMVWNGADKRVPPSGVDSRSSLIKLGAYALHQRWSRLDRCRAQRLTLVTGASARSGTSCAGRVAVRTYVVTGTPHSWPTGSPTNPFSATDLAELFIAPRLAPREARNKR